MAQWELDVSACTWTTVLSNYGGRWAKKKRSGERGGWAVTRFIVSTSEALPVTSDMIETNMNLLCALAKTQGGSMLSLPIAQCNK